VSAVVAIVAAATLAGCGGDAGGAGGAGAGKPSAIGGRDERISFDTSSCAPRWTSHDPGAYEFSVDNESDRAGSVSLVDFGSGVVVARLGDTPPKSVVELRAHLEAGGAYQWTCELEGLAPRSSAPVQVEPPPSFRDSAPPVPAPVATVQLIGPLSSYRRYVDRLLGRVKAQLDALRGQIAAGDLAGAKSAWLAAHLTWLGIGQDDGAYGAFSDLGAQIDGTAAGVLGGTSSPKFTGFHKVELDLFLRHDMSAAGRDAMVLARLVGSITRRALASAYLPPTTTSINAWTLRCHEILEDALRDSLSADDDYGSNSDLASVTADVAATHEMLKVLAPLITPRAPGVVASGERDLGALSRALAAARTPHGVPSLTSLTLRRRQRIDAAAGAALEALAPVSELMQIGST
jgi:high-affinity iron transporter